MIDFDFYCEKFNFDGGDCLERESECTTENMDTTTSEPDTTNTTTTTSELDITTIGFETTLLDTTGLRGTTSVPMTDHLLHLYNNLLDILNYLKDLLGLE